MTRSEILLTSYYANGISHRLREEERLGFSKLIGLWLSSLNNGSGLGFWLMQKLPSGNIFHTVSRRIYG